MIGFLPGETIKTEVRRHWFIFFKSILVYCVLAMLPLTLKSLISKLPFAIPDLGITDIFWFLVAAWWLLLWSFFAVAWSNYFLDILILTDRRVIDIEQKRLFSRDLAEMRFENIQDVRVEIHGFLPTLLNFGHIHMQTAGASREFVIRNIPNPNHIKDLLLSEYDSRTKKS